MITTGYGVLGRSACFFVQKEGICRVWYGFVWREQWVELFVDSLEYQSNYLVTFSFESHLVDRK